MKHRKLFPAENNSTYSTQTADCTFCSPDCPPSSCIPIIIVDYPPPPPPPPPPHHHDVSPYLIIFLCLVFSFFLFIMFKVIRTKLREVNQVSRNNGAQQAQLDGSDQELVDENGIDHPIWYISTAGLQQSIINSISVCKYKKGEGLIEGTECSVCLNEFQEDETLRLLPKCNHAFHVPCIDTWLKSHTNCPMCRAGIVSSSVSAPLPSVDRNSANSTTVTVNPRIENSQTDRENQERNHGQAGGNRTGTEEGEVLLLQAADAARILKDGVNSNENGVLQVLHDSGEDDPQSLRRSVSFDENEIVPLELELDDHGGAVAKSGNFSVDQIQDVENYHSAIAQKQHGENSSNTPRQTGSCSSIAQRLHKIPVSMKRSCSCRRNKNHNTILPL